MKKLILLIVLLFPIISEAQGLVEYGPADSMQTGRPDTLDVDMFIATGVQLAFIFPLDSQILLYRGPIIVGYNADSTISWYKFQDTAGLDNMILRYNAACNCLIWTVDSGTTSIGDSLVWGMYGYNDSMIVIDLTQNVWTDLSNIFTEIDSRGIYHSSDTLISRKDGVYEILISHTLRMLDGPGVPIFRFLVNGDSTGTEWGEYVGTSSDIITGAIILQLDSADTVTVQVTNINNDNDIMLYRGQMLVNNLGSTSIISIVPTDNDTIIWYSGGIYSKKTPGDTLTDQGINYDSLLNTIWPELNTNRINADSGLFGVDSTYLMMINRGDSGNIPQQGANGIVYWVTPTGGVGGADTTYVIWKTDTQMVLNNGYIHIEDSIINTLHNKLQMDTAIINGDTILGGIDMTTANVTIQGNWDFQGGSLIGDSIASPYLSKLNVYNGDTTGSHIPIAGEIFADTNANEAYIATPNWNKIALLHSYFQAYEDTTYILTFANPGVYVAYFPEEISPIFKNMSISGDSGILTANPGLHSVLFTASVSGSIDSMGIKGNVFVGNNKSPYLRCEAHVDTAKSSDIIIAGYIIMDAGSILTIKFESENGDRLYIHDAVFAMKREYE